MNEEPSKMDFRNLQDVRAMIEHVTTLFDGIKNPQQIRVSGRFQFPKLGLDLEYNNKDCNGCCSTNCSGCSACSGCSGCSSTSTSGCKWDPTIVESAQQLANVAAGLAPGNTLPR